MSSGMETPQAGIELSPDEYVWRRIAEANAKDWLGPDGSVDPNAFKPNRGDTDGLSLSRARTAVEAAATGTKGKRFYAARLRVGDIVRTGKIRIIGDTSVHAIIPGWTPATRKTAAVIEGAEYLASICEPAQGPFEGQREASNPPLT